MASRKQPQSARSGHKQRSQTAKLTFLNVRRSLGLTAALLVGLTTGLWATQMIIPPAAVAYTSRISLFLPREPNESFEVFVQRAEIIARAAVQRSFDADVMITDVVVTVVGSNQGISLPILTVEVSRSDWQLRPDVRYWARYFQAAEGLMEQPQ